MIYFSWLRPDARPSKAALKREDEKIFHLEIRQKEGGFAVARVVVENKGEGLLKHPDKRHAAISLGDQLLFRGNLIGMPTRIDNQLMAMEFTAAPSDQALKRVALIRNIKEGEGFDELLYPENVSLGHALQAKTQLPHWCRTSGELRLSDIFSSDKAMSVGDQFFYDSLQCQFLQTPLSAVSVQLKAEWTQKGRGWCELSQTIKDQFPKGLISTLTPKSLEKSWWRAGQSIGRTGYRVEMSHLKKLRQLGANYKKTSDAIKPEKRDITFARCWYDLKLALSWFYQQKRVERARMTLNHDVQALASFQAQHRQLEFSLNSIVGENHAWRAQHRYTKGFCVSFEGKIYRCVQDHTTAQQFQPEFWRLVENAVHVDGQVMRQSFFNTDRGHKVIDHALDIAKAHLAASARAISVKFSGRLEDLGEVTLDHTIKLKDPRLPGGKVEGKVTAYSFQVDGQSGEKVAHVTLGVAVGCGAQMPHVGLPGDTYAQEGVFEEVHTWGQEPFRTNRSGIRYRVTSQTSTLAQWRDSDLVKGVNVKWNADEQNQAITQSDSESRVLQNLKEKTTDIDIRLRDLNMTSCMEKMIDVEVDTKWSAPSQIDLSA